jgi:arginyl-tRNA--protein-N-Asp/Glu arginylyltransferase
MPPRNAFWENIPPLIHLKSVFMALVINDEAQTCSLQVTLEPSSYTEEKYELFKAYQTSIHNDHTSPYGFKQFLVESPLKVGSLLPR